MSALPVARVFSYGGGLDSFAGLLMSVERKERPDIVAFVDVADPSHLDPGEWSGTYRHIEEVVRPFCARERIQFEVIDSGRYPVRDARSLFAWMEARKQIPVSGPDRICTTIAKVERFEAWARDRWPAELVEVWICFEAGEEARAAKDPNAGGKRKPRSGDIVRRNRFPLIEWGMCRCRCEAFVRARGYAVPRKSACTFCPYGTKGDFQALAREAPEEFARIVALEANKPPTKKNGAKLSIKDFRTVRRPDGSKEYRPKFLPTLIQGAYKPKRTPCLVCGAPERASKAMGCDWLAEAS